MTELEKAKFQLLKAEKQQHKDLAVQQAIMAQAFTMIDIARTLRELREILEVIKTEVQLQRSVGVGKG